MRVLIGTGILNWNRHERVGDRYGAVGLWPPLDSDFQEPLESVEGYGTLVAEVIETRQSRHIGDFFRGLFPSTPEVGEEITLGSGFVFYEDGPRIGLQPDDGRETDWLDPEALYQVHEQTVNLYFDQ